MHSLTPEEEEDMMIKSFLMSDRAISLLRKSLVDRIRAIVREYGYTREDIVREVDDMRILLRILNGAISGLDLFEKDETWDALLEDVDITGI